MYTLLTALFGIQLHHHLSERLYTRYDMKYMHFSARGHGDRAFMALCFSQLSLSHAQSRMTRRHEVYYFAPYLFVARASERYLGMCTAVGYLSEHGLLEEVSD